MTASFDLSTLEYIRSSNTAPKPEKEDSAHQSRRRRKKPKLSPESKDHSRLCKRYPVRY